MIVMLILCILACFAAPVALVRTPRFSRQPSLERVEATSVAALLAGELTARDYRDEMARLARTAALLDRDPASSAAEFH